MQQLKTAVALFCTACICAELVGRLLGDVGGRQCIKAAASLYILVTLFHALPGIRAGLVSFTPPDVQASNFGSMTDTVLQQAQLRLAQQLESEIFDETNLSVDLSVLLKTSPTGVQAVQVNVYVPDNCSVQDQDSIQKLLSSTLQTDAIVWIEQAEGG